MESLLVDAHDYWDYDIANFVFITVRQGPCENEISKFSAIKL
jgi:hypothetical protein